MSRKKRKTKEQKTRGRTPPPPAREKKVSEEPRPPRTPRPEAARPPSRGLWESFRSALQPASAHIRSDLPLYGCWVNKGWEEAGMAMVYMARRMENGNIVFGAYLIDVLGVGLKDSFGNVDIPENLFNGQVLSRLNQGQFRMVKAEPSLARRLVWGGYAWAQKHGFRVPREFNRWHNLVGGLEEGESVDDIAFGKDGKPLLIMGLGEIGKYLR